MMRTGCGYLIVLITAGPSTKLCAWGEEDCGGDVLCDTTDTACVN
jgi:hypothetical protein